MTNGKLPPKPTNKIDETIIDERMDRKGNPAKTEMFLHENVTTKEKLIRLTESHKTKSGKWYSRAQRNTVFFLSIKSAINFIKSLFKWSNKHKIELSGLEEIKKESTEKLSQELKDTQITLEQYKKRNEELTLEMSKREENFKKERELETIKKLTQYKTEISDFDTLLQNFKKDNKNEEDLQNFLKIHPWFLNLYYKDFSPQKIGSVDSRFDFYLKRFDDSEEVIELKRADAIFTIKDGSISSEFSQALDQMLTYFDIIQDTSSQTRISKKMDIHEFYPRGVLIFGYNPSEETKQFISKWRNATRIEINTYDQILEKFKITVENLEKNPEPTKKK